MALELFARQFAAVPVYRRYCQACGASPGSVADWRGIPSLPIRAFKEFDLASDLTERPARVFLSSGTSEAEHRSRHVHTNESLAVYEASLLPWFNKHLLAPGLGGRTGVSSTGSVGGNAPGRGGGQCAGEWILLSLTPSAQAAPHSSLVYMLDTIGRNGPFASVAFLGLVEPDGSWRLNLPQAARALQERAGDHRPVLVVGTAFSFVHVLDHLLEKGERVQLPPGSRAMETGGYKGRSRVLPRAELHLLMAETLGLAPENIVTEYGMTELSSQAYDAVAGTPAGHPRSFLFPPWTRARVVSPETGLETAPGEAGLLRVCDLANLGSVLALQTEDLAMLGPGGFQLLGRAEQAEPRGCSLMLTR